MSKRVTQRNVWLATGFSILITISLVSQDAVSIEWKEEIRTERNVVVAEYNNKSDQLIATLARESEYGNVSLEYWPLHATCRVPVRPLQNFSNLCWTDCKSGCNRDDGWETRLQSEGKILCAPNVVLLGVRKSGTTDMTGW